ncbi:hypothetical protein [Halorientalis persicus]|nr:hypothetical protein [Halorientalis persicus]
MGDAARSHARTRFRKALEQNFENENRERNEVYDEAINRLLRISGDVKAIDQIAYDIAENPDEIGFPGDESYPK